MENKDRTRTQEAQGQLILESEGLSHFNKILNGANDKAVINWLEQLNNFRESHSQKHIDNLEVSRQNYTQFRKKFQNHLKNHSKKIAETESIRSYFLEEQYRELYNIIHSLQSLPSFLLKLGVFNGYTSCQIIAHEKGQAYATSTSCSHEDKVNIKRFPIETFNKAYQTVKKSKSRLFSNESLPYGFTDSIGTFLAQSFNGKKFNLILIVGRNDFLPPNSNELILFEDVTKNLNPIFNSILLRSNHDDKILNIMELFENMPIPLAIKDRSGQYLFKNFEYEKLKEVEIKEFEHVSKVLTGKNTLNLFFDNHSHKETDLYHFYKVTLLGELLNTLRHELSNPLFGISLATDIIDVEDKDNDIQETLTDIKSNSIRCQNIIKNFSNLYEDEDNFKKFDLIALIKETIILTKSETKGIYKSIDCNHESIKLYSNPTWISQIIFNLIINSAQAIEEKFQASFRNSFIKIRIEAEQSRVLINVSDNGPGLSKEDQAKIFSPFYTTKNSGTGLGLSICANLVNKLDGNISAKGTPQDGATFSISLPIEIL